MPISLIKKNQLDANVADLVGQYGSGFFIPIRYSGDLFSYISGVLSQISGVDLVNGLGGFVNISGNSGINVSVSTGNNSILVSYTGQAYNQSLNTGDGVNFGYVSTVSGAAFGNRPTVNGTGVLLSGEAAKLPVTIVYTTGDQSISGIKAFKSRPTVNGTGVLLSGEIPSTGYLTGYATTSNLASGILGAAQLSLAYSLISEQNSLEQLTALSGSLTGIYATYSQLTGLSGYEAGITNLLATYEQLTGLSGFEATVHSAFATYSQLTGLSGYSATVTNLATTGSTLVSQISSLSGTLTGNYALKSQTGSFVTTAQTGQFVSTAQTGDFYAANNPSGYITGVNLSSYITTGQTGNFYAANNPSGYITGVDLSAYAPKLNPQLTGTPIAPTATTGTNTTQIATTAFVQTALLSLLNIPKNVLDIIPRMNLVSNPFATNGKVNFTMFTPLVNLTVSSFAISAGAGNSLAGATLVRLGLYVWNEDTLTATLVARTANDTSIFATSNTTFTRNFDTTGGYPASYTLVAGSRYAVAWIVVGATQFGRVPALIGQTSIFQQSPIIARTLAAQTDLPTSTNSTVSNDTAYNTRLA